MAPLGHKESWEMQSQLGYSFPVTSPHYGRDYNTVVNSKYFRYFKYFSI